MENLQRRASGIFVARLVVPERLRHLTGRREFIASTGTTQLAIAKIVASATLARWRQQLFDLERLAVPVRSMKHQAIINIADGHPLLAADSFLPLRAAADLLGLEEQDLLRLAASSKLQLHHRFEQTWGYLVSRDELPVDDPELGTRVVPGVTAMPKLAVRYRAAGTLPITAEDAPDVASSLMATGQVTLVLVQGPHGGDEVFVPDQEVTASSASIEIATGDLRCLRDRLAQHLHPARVEAAREALHREVGLLHVRPEKKGQRLFSKALDVYASKYLPQHITSAKEIARVKSGIGLFIELMGDMPLGQVDADRLREFRDDQLARVPARENQVRGKFGTTSVAASIRATSGTDWPIMSAAERDLRIQWISRMFGWACKQGWIESDPSLALHGESVQSKAERKLHALAKKDRLPFTPDELRSIFSQDLFKNGRGTQTKAGTFREYRPFYYWLPLLGLYAGGRENELCQLWLDDVRQTEAGTWYLDINERTPDKSLKRQKGDARCWSARRVPLHPALIEAGFLEWCNRLRAAGYKRVFPELKWNETKRYTAAPVKVMARMFEQLGMPRDNTKVFHSFRHVFNNAVMRLTCPPEIRKRLMGHSPGEGVNEQHYLTDPSPDETAAIVATVNFSLPSIEKFDLEAGMQAVDYALRTKNRGRGAEEDLGPAGAARDEG